MVVKREENRHRKGHVLVWKQTDVDSAPEYAKHNHECRFSHLMRVCLFDFFLAYLSNLLACVFFRLLSWYPMMVNVYRETRHKLSITQLYKAS